MTLQTLWNSCLFVHLCAEQKDIWWYSTTVLSCSLFWSNQTFNLNDRLPVSCWGINDSVMVDIHHKSLEMWMQKQANWNSHANTQLINELELFTGPWRVKIGHYQTLKISLKYHDIFWILLYRDISKWCNIRGVHL